MVKKEIKIINPREIEKESHKKPITFRTDENTYAKILTLEQATKNSKADVIRKAIVFSYEKFISRQIYSILFKDMNKVFGETTAKTFTFSFEDPDKYKLKDDNKIINPFEKNDYKTEISETVLFNVKKNKKYVSEVKKRKIYSDLKMFKVEVKQEKNQVIKIKIHKMNILHGKFEDFNTELYFKINNLGIKNKLKTESEGFSIRDQNEVNFNVYLEIELPVYSISDDTNFEKSLKDMKKFISEVNKLLEKDNQWKSKKKSS